jgi:quercetin dioxygenase-like cupin family protein
MLVALLLVFLARQVSTAPTAPPPGPIPGNCAEPARDNAGRLGCYLAAELTIEKPPPLIRWHLYRFPDEKAAREASARHAASVVTYAHGGVWLHVLDGAERIDVPGAESVAVIGPMQLTADGPVKVRFLESIFPAGMTTRVHSHSGPEGFYVLDGVQCMETPEGRTLIGAGKSFHLPARMKHLQSSAKGRRNMAVVFQLPREPWMTLDSEWKPAGLCAAE